MDEKFLRWVRSSIVNYFDTALKDKIVLYIETSEHIGSDGIVNTREDKWAEIRINGPFTRQITGNEFIHTIDVNVLVSTKLDQTNLYNHDDNVGIVYAAFGKFIPIYKYPSEEFLECFQLDSDRRDPIIVAHFGQIEYDVKLTQSTVQGHYTMQLEI